MRRRGSSSLNSSPSRDRRYGRDMPSALIASRHSRARWCASRAVRRNDWNGPSPKSYSSTVSRHMARSICSKFSGGGGSFGLNGPEKGLVWGVFSGHRAGLDVSNRRRSKSSSLGEAVGIFAREVRPIARGTLGPVRRDAPRQPSPPRGAALACGRRRSGSGGHPAAVPHRPAARRPGRERGVSRLLGRSCACEPSLLTGAM